MSELLIGESTTQTPEELLQQALQQMPENMRLYNELVSKRNTLLEERDKKYPALDGIDLDLQASLHGEAVAYAALDLYIANRHLDIVNAELSELEQAGGYDTSAPFRGRKVRIEPLGDVFRIIKHFDGGGVYRATSRPKSGVITDIALSPSNGGRIEFWNNFSRAFYSAGPLFDRYQQEPQFRIELI